MAVSGIFRALILAALAFFVASFIAAGFDTSVPEPVADFIDEQSAGSLGTALHTGNFGTKLAVAILLTSFFVGYVVALLGMLRFHRWARLLFVFMVPMSVIIDAAYGTNIERPIDAVVSTLRALCEGALLALLFLEPVRARFREPPPPPVPPVSTV